MKKPHEPLRAGPLPVVTCATALFTVHVIPLAVTLAATLGLRTPPPPRSIVLESLVLDAVP